MVVCSKANLRTLAALILAQLIVMKSISSWQLAAKEPWLWEMCAVPLLPFPADGPRRLWLYAGELVTLCCYSLPWAAQRCTAAPKGAHWLPELDGPWCVASWALETQPTERHLDLHVVLPFSLQTSCIYRIIESFWLELTLDQLDHQVC